MERADSSTVPVFTLIQAARLLLLGAIAAVVLRSLLAARRFPSDHATRLTAVWGTCAFVVIGCRVMLESPLSPAALAFTVRLRYFTSLVPIPLLLLVLVRAAPARLQRVGRTAVVIMAGLAASVWLDGAVFGSELGVRHTLLGRTYPMLEIGPVHAWIGPLAAAAAVVANLMIPRGSAPGEADTRTIVRGGCAALVPAGFNDTLLDAGLIQSIELIDLGCFLTLLIAAAVLTRRSTLSFGTARANIVAQTRELEQTQARLAREERRATLGALAAGVGHEVNNPLTVVMINVQAAIRHLATDRSFGARSAQQALSAALADARSMLQTVTALEEHHTANWPPETVGVDGMPVQDAESAAPPSSVRGLRYLIIDDDPTVARSLRRALKHRDVLVAHSGAEALAIARSKRIDVYVCDVMMPGMNGPEVFATLRHERLLGEAHFIFVTGGAFAREVMEALEKTGAPALRKPVAAADIEACLDALQDTREPSVGSA